MNKEKVVEVLEMIVQNMADDAKNFDDKPFTERTFAEYFGNRDTLMEVVMQFRPPLAFVDKEELSIIYGISEAVSELLSRENEDD